MMVFGDAFRSIDATISAEWLDQSCRGEWWTVGALVPNQYETLLRVRAPEPIPGDWWSLYRDLFETIATIGEAHTSTPDRGWFAIWEGHGFDTVSTQIAWPEAPVDEMEQTQRDLERRRLAVEDQRRNAEIREALGLVSRFERPGRRYYALTAPVNAVTRLRYPGDVEWRNPDLFWPDDRRWFVATDVDFWSLYIGGTASFAAAVATRVPTPTEPVDLNDELEIED